MRAALTLAAAGRRALVDRPLAPLMLMLAVFALALAAEVASLRASAGLAEALRTGSLRPLWHGAATLLVSLSFGGLTFAAAEAVALARLGAVFSVDEVDGWRALARVPSLITLNAAEWVVTLALFFGLENVALVAAPRLDGAWLALLLALATAPALVLGAWCFGATRLAVLATLRGAAPAPALLAGLALVRRRWPALLALAAATLWASLPFSCAALGALALAHWLGSKLLGAFAAALWTLPLLSLYTTLAVFSEREARTESPSPSPAADRTGS